MVASAFSSDNERQEVPVGMCGGWMCLAELWSSNRRQLNELTEPASRSNKRQGDRGPTRMDGGAATSRLVLALRASTTYE